MTKEVIKGRIEDILDNYSSGLILQREALERITDIVIEGAEALSKDAKQEADSRFNNIITLKDGYKIRLKGYFSDIKMEKKC